MAAQQSSIHNTAMIINNSITPPTAPPVIAPLSELLLLLLGTTIDMHIHIHKMATGSNCMYIKHYHSVM